MSLKDAQKRGAGQQKCRGSRHGDNVFYHLDDAFQGALMKLWPSDSFEIETTMSPSDIFAALGSKVELPKIFRCSSEHADFQGKVFRDGFKIVRIIHYGNPFLPVITGKFSSGKGGTTVSIHMRIHHLYAALSGLWFGPLTLVLLASLVKGSPFIFAELGMLLLGWGMVLACFGLEARKQKPMLIQMFKVES